MTRDPIVRRRKIKVAVAALVVGLVLSALVAIALLYMAGIPLGP